MNLNDTSFKAEPLQVWELSDQADATGWTQAPTLALSNGYVYWEDIPIIFKRACQKK